MKDLAGPELAQLLRESFPEMNLAEFNNHLKPMSDERAQQFRAEHPDPEDHNINESVINVHKSRCAALSAFADQFLVWVRAGRAEPVRRALELIDRLLAETPPLPKDANPNTPGFDHDQFHNSLLACFLETALYLSPTPALRSLVVPNLGPAIRAHLEEYEPWILEET
jgi:hypothetical protein